MLLIGRGVPAEVFAWLGKRRRWKQADSLLAKAASAGDVVAVRALIEHGANVNGEDGWGRAAITLAAYTNRVEIVEILLAAGADPAIRDRNGRPPIHYILAYDDVTDIWLREEFDVLDYDRASPSLETEAVKLLIAAGSPMPWE